ncbi:hypothetical protein F5878DRAFT_542667 [Lentinula raphanica]|uniref:Chromatin target of PRMT1 protein C-terminal domain-containing protein n=1 Tax=Lentinula raphanica TaxID=153919 RepID=A0AA38UF23_9AGAR|nr:hypothetical protein F5878DRAFT_542667 [Lentinula raphanica]
MDISTTTGLSILEPTSTYEDPVQVLSYDEDVPYEAQVSSTTSSGLASRIGTTKVYLLSESSAASTAKSRGSKTSKWRPVSFDITSRNKLANDPKSKDPTLRPNALLIQGTPVSHLPTARIFAYATHFIPSSSSTSHPLALEWISDTTCILVFSSRTAARHALQALTKAAGEEPDEAGFVTAKHIPVALWPPEERINRSLGISVSDNAQDGQSPMKGTMKIRWAKIDDVKKRGAQGDSEFYKKHGRMAGKELFNGRDLPSSQNKRQRLVKEANSVGAMSEDLRRQQLDQDLDAFLAEGEAEDTAAMHEYDDLDRDSIIAQSPSSLPTPPSPPSKMRSDYIANDGRTILGDTVTDIPKLDLASRLISPLPRRGRNRDRNRSRSRNQGNMGVSLEDRLWSDGKGNLADRITSEFDDEGFAVRNGRGDRDRNHGRGHSRRGRGSGRGNNPKERDSRPKKSQQELDDELDAFLREE